MPAQTTPYQWEPLGPGAVPPPPPSTPVPTSDVQSLVLRHPSNIGTDQRGAVPYVKFQPFTRTNNQGGMTAPQQYFFATGNTENFLSDSVPTNSVHIVLPLPSSALNTNYAVTYEPFQLGQYGPLLAQGGNKMIADAAVAAAAGAAAAYFLGKNNKEIAKAAIGAGTVAATLGTASMGSFDYVKQKAATEGLAFLDPALGNIVTAGYFQKQLNPFTEHLFKDVQMREHVFSYTFVPQSYSESLNIDEIIQTFKYYMLPAFGMSSFVENVIREGTGANQLQQAMLTFPYEFKIFSSVQDTTFQILPSILHSVNVTYSGSSPTPVFFKSDDNNKKYPAEISLTLNFKEILILTRDKISALRAENSDTQSGVNREYGDNWSRRFRY